MKTNWKTTFIGIAAAACGILSEVQSPAPAPIKTTAKLAAWTLAGFLGKAAADAEK